MRKRYFRNRTLTLSLAVQEAAIKSQYPGFDTHLQSHTLKVTGQLRPSPRSEPYTAKIHYGIEKGPEIWILQPKLVKNFRGDSIPHLYPDMRLCLYQPLYGEFRPFYLLTETIIPWTSLWLFHYENWQMTGGWEGGGEHPHTEATRLDTRNLLM